MNSELTFISNNITGTQNSVKRMKLFEHLKSYITASGFIFLQAERGVQRRALFLPWKKKLMRSCYRRLRI